MTFSLLVRYYEIEFYCQNSGCFNQFSCFQFSSQILVVFFFFFFFLDQDFSMKLCPCPTVVSFIFVSVNFRRLVITETIVDI